MQKIVQFNSDFASLISHSDGVLGLGIICQGTFFFLSDDSGEC